MSADRYLAAHGKVNIFEDDEQTRKDIFEIYRGIANIKDEISDNEFSQLIELISGKHNANAITALINNWSQVEDSLKQAQNAAGTAQEEQEKYAKSMKGQLAELKSTWQAFSNDFFESDFFTGFIDSGTVALDTLDGIIKGLGTIPTLLTVITGIASAKGVGELINQFQFLIILRIEYAHKVPNGNTNDTMCNLVS